MLKPHFQLLADYNASMNQKICASIAELSDDALWQDKGAFFASILGTLNHIMVGDLIWLTRFNGHPNDANGFNALSQLSEFTLPSQLTQTLYNSKEDYTHSRLELDSIIIQFIKELAEVDLSQSLTYTNSKSAQFSKPFSQLLLHLFNHQTHHRGQVTTLLKQMDIDVSETDLLVLIDQA
ncbi:DinB family protein [Psychrobacter pygoscelis]|uniref:DinB family protein n=1 Tax=Psychrobacter pygoscelis TaxID=2488563 RepID=UPI00103A0B29|nr:DinB family protein [Psychrobacter pygoscelis]